ncbi:MAG: hypothetical protein JW875_04385 [Spirochaetales bacterium]|nr:hypothetical protein [Spirochaetales bacterium]
MIRNILAGYTDLLQSLLRFVALFAVSLGLGALVVWPLWRLAVGNPQVYTLASAVFATLIIVSIIAVRLRRAYIRDKGLLYTSLIRRLIVVVGVSTSVFFVMHYQRLIALACAFLTLILYGMVAFGINPRRRSSPKNPQL